MNDFCGRSQPCLVGTELKSPSPIEKQFQLVLAENLSAKKILSHQGTCPVSMHDAG
jgi:hypothetical protein